MTDSVLLALLERELFSAEVQLPTDIDWTAVFVEAQKQTVLGLLKLPDTAPEDVRNRYDRWSAQHVMTFIRYLHAQDLLHDLLVKAGIPYAILKGCAAAVQYPRPFVRSMGDIDFIVPRERFHEAGELLKMNGYAHGKEGHPRHRVFYRDGFVFELHHHFSHDLPVEDQYIDEGLKHIVAAEIEGHAFHMLPPLANGLTLLDHMRTHLQDGMGLRQAIDWMMFVNRYLDDAFWHSEFEAAARACGLETLALTATGMCQKYLGLDASFAWCQSADEELCDRLMNSLLVSGNFGRKNESGSIVEATVTRIKSNGLFQTLQSTGEKNWKALKTHPELKPFAWIYRSYRLIKRGLSIKRGAKIRDDLKRGVERSALLKDLKIE